jgi:hypothetical protein
MLRSGASLGWRKSVIALPRKNLEGTCRIRAGPFEALVKDLERRRER